MAISLVDLKKRPPAPAELKRFAARHGARALLDESGKAYLKAGLGYLTMGDDEILDRCLADPRLLRLPLVRNGDDVTIGVDEETWREWHKRG
jgi:arsenate reductase-like glutaredoxin family protein